MRTIHKYRITETGRVLITMPRGAVLLSVGNQFDAVSLWALVDDREPMRRRWLAVAEIGQTMEPGARFESFIGTVISHDGRYVRHVFDGGWEPHPDDDKPRHPAD